MIERNIDQSLECATCRQQVFLPLAIQQRAIWRKWEKLPDLLRIASSHRRLHLAQALGDEQRSIDEHTVGGAVDLEVAEQNIGPEERQDLVDTVVGLAVGGHFGIGVRRERREGVCGAASAGAEGEDGEIACRSEGEVDGS